MQEMSDTDLNYLFNLLEEKNIPIIHPRKHSYIMHQGIESEYIYILKKGVAKLSNILRDGREFSTFYVTDTDFVSLLESKDHGNINTSVFSVRVETSDTYFYKVPRKKLDEWVNEDNCLSNIIGNFYKRRLIHNIEVHKRMSVNGKKGAVYACLSIMVDYFGIKKTEGILIDFKLTNDDIAGFCGISTRNSVNRILHDLKEGGIIKIVDKKILITNFEFLEDYNK